MKKLILRPLQYITIVVVLFFQTTALSQSCLPDGITFSTQAEIDNFQTNYPGCTEIGGDVRIRGDEIINFFGLSTINTIGGKLFISGNPSLQCLEGLNNLTSIGSELWISSNNLLTDLSGLDDLVTIGDNLSILGNDMLVNLTGLSSLVSIDGYLWIRNNEALTTLEGMSNLVSLGGKLKIFENISLLNLNGINNIASESISELFIHDNASLTSCDAQNICAYLSNPTGTVHVYNNGAGCNNPSEIASSCGMTFQCLPFGNYYCINQDDVDNFQTNYPNCTDIEGDLIISGNNIKNLVGLNVITTIGGDLKINSNDSLLNLTGLNNLTLVTGNITIRTNDTMNDLTGLEDLISINGDLEIGSNHILKSLSGISNLLSIGGKLSIYHNDSLSNFSGLNSLTLINESIHIFNNDNLLNLTGLENLTTVNGNILLVKNKTLKSLSGINNIDASTFKDLMIVHNDSLTSCEVENICSYLDYPGGKVTIYDNGDGCNSPPQIAESCGITLSCLPYGDFYFLTQSEIDNFKTDYDGCTTLNGNIEIRGSNIVSLSGFEDVTTIDGNLTIGGSFPPGGTDSLINLDGIGNISKITGYLQIKQNWSLTELTNFHSLTSIDSGLVIYNNPYLTSLSGLNNLDTVGIFLSIYRNYRLNDLSGLDNLKYIGGGLHIVDCNFLNNISSLGSITRIDGELFIGSNNSLKNLVGLENIESSSIAKLRITQNDSLATCDIISICDFLSSPGGEITIYNNLEGCNSQEEILEACADWVIETNPKSPFTIYPNPTSGQITIVHKNNIPITGITIYNQLGQKVLHKAELTNSIDVSTLKQGIYIIEINSGKFRIREKLIVSE